MCICYFFKHHFHLFVIFNLTTQSLGSTRSVPESFREASIISASFSYCVWKKDLITIIIRIIFFQGTYQLKVKTSLGPRQTVWLHSMDGQAEGTKKKWEIEKGRSSKRSWSSLRNTIPANRLKRKAAFIRLTFHWEKRISPNLSCKSMWAEAMVVINKEKIL